MQIKTVAIDSSLPFKIPANEIHFKLNVSVEIPGLLIHLWHMMKKNGNPTQ